MRKLLLSAATFALAGFQPALSMAAEAAGAASADAATRRVVAIGAGLAIGVAAFGAALGQGRVGASAVESIGGNPNAADIIFLPLILGLAVFEALDLYGYLITFYLMCKILLRSYADG